MVDGLCAGLVNRRAEVDLITMAFRDLPREERHDGLYIRRVPCLRAQASICHAHEMLSYLLAAVPIARRMARTRNYHLIHAHFIFPDGVLARHLHRATGIPYVITAHGSDVPGYNPDRFRTHHKVLGPIWRRVARDAESVIFPSQSLKRLAKQSEPTLATDVVPNGFQSDRYTPRSERAGILAVTRMFERKGMQYLVQALDGVPDLPPVNIVGDGPYLETLRGLVEDQRAPVRLWGWLDNDSEPLRELYETSKIFVFPSISENFPIVLLEAMSAGLAIVTTAGTGCAEVVGDAGVLVPPGDVGALRMALTRLLNDPGEVERLSQAARHRVAEHFSWPVVVQKYLDLYGRHALGG